VANIVLGVSGSIAAYRAADLARDLIREGHTVRALLTDAAEHFVSRSLFEALTGQPTLSGVFEEPIPGRMAHIDWARQADAIVLAPATANTIAKAAAGVGDDMLTTLMLAYTGPILIAPAMNPSMYSSEAIQKALNTLRERGAVIVEPDEGDVACGEHGQGKLASNARIVQAVSELLGRAKLLDGQNVLITSGPTQEPMDDVRYLSNHSSGKMGAALVRAALLLGAQVTVVTGPTATPLPLQARVLRVRTAEEMLAAALPESASSHWIIGAAAVADYRPANRITGKMRRQADSLTLELIPNPDVLRQLAQAAPEAKVVAFAAEPTADLEIARRKLAERGFHAIAANDVSRPDIAFGSDYNELSLVTAEGHTCNSGRRSKLGCALWLFERLVSG
jgi:phosphopantothenoylcysteine decarboxylase / phosphopantothenate---cysteine ligase